MVLLPYLQQDNSKMRLLPQKSITKLFHHNSQLQKQKLPNELPYNSAYITPNFSHENISPRARLFPHPGIFPPKKKPPGKIRRHESALVHHINLAHLARARYIISSLRYSPMHLSLLSLIFPLRSRQYRQKKGNRRRRRRTLSTVGFTRESYMFASSPPKRRSAYTVLFSIRVSCIFYNTARRCGRGIRRGQNEIAQDEPMYK